MDQQWREQAVGAVRGLLLWAGIVNIFAGLVLSLTMLMGGASFWMYMFMLIPAIVGVWEISKINQLSDRWLVSGSQFYGQAIFSLIFASWIASILLCIAGGRLQKIARNHQ